MASSSNQSDGRAVYIGCSSAFWGDSSAGAWQLVNSAPHLDYLVADYLAEVTMGILASVKAQGGARGGMGEGGYVAEFVEAVWKPLSKTIQKKGIKIITNAGGLNPLGCKAAIEKAAQAAGLEIPRVAVVVGDDILSFMDDWREQNLLQPLVVEGEAEGLWPKDRPLLSSNAYFGALPIAEALRQGAQIVITGRCADSALVLGPLMFEFGWTKTQFDLLSAGSLAGHIIECGCQATGGNFTDWRLSQAAGWDNVGFPVVECFENGSFIVTKPPETGGIITTTTVGEQMLYEIHDPSSYILPDVICDWRGVTIEEVGKNRVKVQGARGRPPTDFYKVSATSVDGYKLSGELLIGGIEAAEKAKAVGEAIIKRTKRMLLARGFPDFTDVNIEILGAEQLYGPHARTRDTREVVLRIAVRHSDPKALGVFGREVAPAATSMAPGITGAGSGRPRPQPLMHHHSCLISKRLVPVTVVVGSNYKETKTIEVPVLPPRNTATTQTGCPFAKGDETRSCPYQGEERKPLSDATVEVPLIALCVGRSGDKGDISNIGIITRKPEYYPWVRRALTEEAVKSYMAHLVKGVVKRYDVHGVLGFNFVLTQALGGGGLTSLLIDRQGKTYAQLLLSFPVPVPKDLVVRDGLQQLPRAKL